MKHCSCFEIRRTVVVPCVSPKSGFCVHGARRGRPRRGCGDAARSPARGGSCCGRCLPRSPARRAGRRGRAGSNIPVIDTHERPPESSPSKTSPNSSFPPAGRIAALAHVAEASLDTGAQPVGIERAAGRDFRGGGSTRFGRDRMSEFLPHPPRPQRGRKPKHSSTATSPAQAADDPYENSHPGIRSTTSSAPAASSARKSRESRRCHATGSAAPPGR